MMGMHAKRLGLSRLLPKTGQTVIYYGLDDGYYQSGWWKGRKIADNKTRFIAKTLDGDDVVLDLATGLMWAADGNEAGCGDGLQSNWGDAIDYATGLDFAGFTDWRIPNIKELISLMNYGLASGMFDPTYFANMGAISCWSSTTSPIVDITAYYGEFVGGSIATQSKSSDCHTICVRGGV